MSDVPSRATPVLRRAGDWLLLVPPGGGGAGLASQGSDGLPEAAWPDGPVPQQPHLDTTVGTVEELAVQHERVLGAHLLRDRSDDPDEPLCVDADPAGHPSCIFVAGSELPPGAGG